MNSRIQYLLQQYENNNCSREEMEELFHYIRTSKNAGASLKSWVNQTYQGIRNNHPSFAYVNEQGILVTDHAGPDIFEEREPFRKLRKNIYVRMVISAGILLAAFGLIWLGGRYLKVSETPPPEKEKVLIQKKTVNGENKYLLLPDSTQVWLNVGSSLDFYSNLPDDRVVHLTGEAFFKIKPAATPFSIKVSDITLHAQAASSCNIKAYDDENEVIVSVNQGRLQVEREGTRINDLLPGRQVNLGRLDKSVTEKSVPVEKMAAWQWGEYIYDYAMLEDIVADLQRIYNVKILILDPEKKHQKVLVSLRREMGIEGCLSRIAELTNMEVHLVDNEYMLGELLPPVSHFVAPESIEDQVGITG